MLQLRSDQRGASFSCDDAERLQKVTASLERVLPSDLPVRALHVRLYDQHDAGARCFGAWRQLTVGRPLIDHSVPEQLDVKLAHEIAHL